MKLPMIFSVSDMTELWDLELDHSAQIVKYFLNNIQLLKLEKNCKPLTTGFSTEIYP